MFGCYPDNRGGRGEGRGVWGLRNRPAFFVVVKCKHCNAHPFIVVALLFHNAVHHTVKLTGTCPTTASSLEFHPTRAVIFLDDDSDDVGDFAIIG